MARRSKSIGRIFLTSGLLAGLVAGACSSGNDSSSQGGSSGGGNGASNGAIFDLDGGNSSEGTLKIVASSPTIVVDPGDQPPDTVDFDVQGAPDGEMVRWRVTNPEFGTIDSDGVFTPSGKVAGTVEIQVSAGGMTGTIQVTVQIRHEQNGGPQAGSNDPGVGGIGGVGGEGFGDAISADLVDVLKGTPEADSELEMLYPYDETVFPLHMLPPLLQWSKGTFGGDAVDAVYVRLEALPDYEYDGFFGRPAPLGNGDPFIRHPIPPDVWRAATLSAAGKELKLKVVVAAGGKAYGPIEQTWPIALAPVTGTIYYQAYGTNLAKNWPSENLTVAGDRFGGATLGINVGSSEPELIAGYNSEDKTGCRVCHSVSAFGDRMIVQHGDHYSATSSIDLKNNNQESTPYQDGTVGWAGLYPDGSIGLANSIDVTGSNSNDGDTALYDMETGQVLPSPGLKDFATRIGLPMFSPDGTKVAFTFFEGPSTASIGNPTGRELVAMSFDPATNTFSDPELLVSYNANDQRPAWPAFWPSSDALVFQKRWAGDRGNNDSFSTWHGAEGELWWVDLATQTATPLDRANGIGPDGERYIPTGPDDHDADEHLNYEPSMSPVASGGYAWMVFVSRRLYGNVATIGPWKSDPRDYNLIENVTTKKLWMAAIDLNPKPGEDPSHPAFYIPGQELLGTNSRPFFALDPCVSDAGRCTTGIDCCSGFCRDGFCVPPPKDECAAINEKCSSDDDCCDARANCIGGFCATIIK